MAAVAAAREAVVSDRYEWAPLPLMPLITAAMLLLPPAPLAPPPDPDPPTNRGCGVYLRNEDEAGAPLLPPPLAEGAVGARLRPAGVEEAEGG